MPHRPLSMLSHVELLTPELEASVAFARDILGLDVVDEEGDSVYLRCWGDYYRYSLVLTAAAEPGLGHGAWRTWNAEQLDIAVASVEAAGVDGRVGGVLLRPRPRVPLHRPRRPHRRSCSGTSSAPSRPPARSRRIPSARSAPVARHRRAHPRPPHRHRPGRQGGGELAPRRPRLPRSWARSSGEPGAPWFFGRSD